MTDGPVPLLDRTVGVPDRDAFVSSSWRHPSEHLTTVRVAHPVYGAAEELVDDLLVSQSRIDVLAFVQERLEHQLMGSWYTGGRTYDTDTGLWERPKPSRRQQLHDILQSARVTP